MNSIYLQSKIGRAILVLSLLFGIAMVSSITAQAQYPQYPYPGERQDRRDRDRDRDDRYRRGGYGNDVYRIAQRQGYQDGLNTGASDASRGQSYDPQRSHYYRNATYGYDRSYGNNREAYRQAYRSGFVQGYREGFQRYGGNRRRNYGRFPFPFPR